MFVHTAFRPLSKEGFTPQEYIEGLLEHKGPVMMPAFSWKNPEETNVGMIPEIFRVKYATRRSQHPTHSVCGVRADEYLTGEDLTPCGPESPLARLARSDGYVLMAGVGFDCCTLIHHLEEITYPEVYLEGLRHRKLKRDYWKVEDALADRGQLITSSEGNAVFMMFSALDLFNLVFGMLSKDKHCLLSETRYRLM